MQSASSSQSLVGFSELLREAGLATNGPENVRQWRRRAWESFSRVGVPSLRNENWHYSDLRRVAKDPMHWLSPLKLDSTQPAGKDSFTLIFLDGVWQRELSAHDQEFEVLCWPELISQGAFAGLKVEQILEEISEVAETAREDHGGLVDMQRALLERGVLIRVPRGKRLTKPIEFRYLYSDSTKTSALPLMNWILIEENAEAHFYIEALNSAQLTWSEWNHFSLGQGAKTELVRTVSGKNEGVSLGLVTVNQDSDSDFSGRLACEGGRLVRETWLISQEGVDAKSDAQALFLGTQTQHSDMRMVVTHYAERGASQQKARALLNGKSRSTFSGKVTIARDAQLVAAKQLTQSLLLSSGAEANSKPELEIYADNVKANHGATVGQLDPDEIFYLRSRGLSLHQAELMIANGFVNEFSTSVSNLAARAKLERWLAARVESIVVGQKI